MYNTCFEQKILTDLPFWTIQTTLKNLSLQKIFYLQCVCIFSLSYLGVIKYKNMGKMYQIFYQYSHPHYF